MYSAAPAAAAVRSPLEPPRERSGALHTHNTRPGLVLSPARAAGRGPGGGGRVAGMWGGGELASPTLKSGLSEKFHQLRSTAGGSPSRGTLGRAAADWSEVCSPLRLRARDAGGRRLVCKKLRALKTSPVPTQSRSPGGLARVAQVLGAFSESINTDDARTRLKEGQV